jgi:hypothetical protein
MKEGERYQLKRGVVQMEIVSNLCASKEATEKEHARKACVAHMTFEQVVNFNGFQISKFFFWNFVHVSMLPTKVFYIC